MIVNVVGASCKRRDAIRQKQYDALTKHIESGEISTGRGKNQEISLARAGDTRWGSHYRTIIRVFDLWSPVKEVLAVIIEDGTDVKSRVVATSLVDKMGSFEFVFIGRLMEHILGMTNELSQVLQQKNQNIGSAVNLINAVKEELKNFRNDGWDVLLKEVTQFCSKEEIFVPNMDDIIPGRTRRTVDGQQKTNLHYFRVDIFFQVVDHICQEMDNRFSESNSELLMCIACLDPSNSFANFDHARIMRLAEIYSEDFSSRDLVELRHQLNLYYTFMRSNIDYSGLRDIGDLAKKMVEKKEHTIFHFVYRLIELALVLPVATATVERSFYAMKIIKTDLRNKIGDNFLTDCLVCYIEKGIFVKIETEAILQRFQNMASRRLQLSSASRSTSASVGKKK